jgi:hypothetical protein
MFCFPSQFTSSDIGHYFIGLYDVNRDNNKEHWQWLDGANLTATEAVWDDSDPDGNEHAVADPNKVIAAQWRFHEEGHEEKDVVCEHTGQ